MSLSDDFYIVLRNISHRKLRSWLTILGVIIGVASVFALISVSRSLELSIEREFEEFGTDKITIIPATTGTPGFSAALNEKDLDAVDNVKDLEFLAGSLAKSAKVTFQGKSLNMFLLGWPASMSETLFEEFGISFVQGSSFTRNTNSIVVGPRVVELFDGLTVKSKIKIEDEKYEIVGILEEVGNPQDDSQIYMPLDKMRDLFNDQDSLSFISAKIKPGANIDDVADKITASLKKVRSEESFTVITPEQLLEQLGVILGILQGVLGGIATISLLVGSVGIANSMYTSVLERTKDIGIMKSIGATNQEITLIFLIEASLLGLGGGILGVLFGLFIAKLIGFAAAQAGFSLLTITIEATLVLFSLVFATLIGGLAGFLPARQAARLKPVDALRK